MNTQRGDKKRDKKRTWSSDPNVQEFFVEHGDSVEVDRELIFQDGSTAKHSCYGWEYMRPAKNKEPFELARDIHRYWKKTAELTEFAFRTRKEQLEESPSPHFDPEDKLAELKRLKAIARQAQRMMKETEENLNEVTPERDKRRKQLEAQRASEVQQFRERTKAINL